jgi:hypothetical protein
MADDTPASECGILIGSSTETDQMDDETSTIAIAWRVDLTLGGDITLDP